MAHTLTTVDDSDEEIPMLFDDSHRHPITNDYEILQELGVGKFSVVRMAQHKQSKTKVAIKQIDRKVCPAELLVKEVNIMKRLSGCAGVIHLMDVYEEPDKPWTHLVMELVTGGELFDYIVKCSSYSEKSASDYIRQLCQTVEYLHSKNIVHRDLKPENMLFEDPSAQVLKLCDFGLADTLKDEFDFLTLAVGTKSYMAPEVSSNMGYGKPVDMYSIGVILYILLCGYLPIDPDNGIYVLEFPPSEWSGISFEVKLLIKKLLDDSPAARPTATQVLKHAWVRGTNTSTKPLVGTLRNLKSWNQTGGRAVTKPRGQVMNLFDNPPPPSSNNGNSAASSSNDAGASSHQKPRSPNKPKVTKAKKASIPKVVNGVLTLPANPPAALPTQTTTNNTEPASSPSKKPKKPSADQPAATTPSPSKSPKSDAKSDTKSAKSSKKKPEKPVEATPKLKVSDNNANGAPASPGASNSAIPSATENSNSSASGGAPTRHNGDKPQTTVSDRTKQFLQEQDARAAKKQSEVQEKKDRRKSLGTPSKKHDKVEKNEATPTIVEPKKKKDKTEKKEREMGSSAIPTSPLGDTDVVEEKPHKVSKRRSLKDLGTDLDAMIALAMTDDEGPQVSRERSSTTAGIIVSPATKRKSRKVPDLLGGVTVGDTSARSNPSTPTGDFSSFGSDSIVSNSRSNKAASAAAISVGSKSSSSSGLKVTPVAAPLEEHYPKRSSSKPSVAVPTKKSQRMSMGTPSHTKQPKPDAPNSLSSSTPAGNAATSDAPETSSKKKDKHSSSGSRTNKSSSSAHSTATSPSSTPVKQPSRHITVKKAPKAKKQTTHSDDESSSSAPSSPLGDTAKIILEPSSTSEEDVIVVKKKKRIVAKKINTDSSSSSTSRSY